MKNNPPKVSKLGASQAGVNSTDQAAIGEKKWLYNKEWSSAEYLYNFKFYSLSLGT